MGWKRSMGNLRSFLGNSMGGLRGGSNLASWAVAATLAYYLWIKPEQEVRRDQEEKLKQNRNLVFIPSSTGEGGFGCKFRTICRKTTAYSRPSGNWVDIWEREAIQ